MLNAFVLYKLTAASTGKKHLTHLQFQIECARELLRGNFVRQRSKEFHSSGVGKADPKYHHLDRLFGRKGAGGVKTAKNIVPETVFGCPTCKTYFHNGAFYAKFHENLKFD